MTDGAGSRPPRRGLDRGEQAGVAVEGGAGTVGQRLRAGAIAVAARLAASLPEAPLVALADAAGELWYRAAPGRAEQARRNLRRVAAWLARERCGPLRARAAATDDRALERLVRGAFRHHARYYLEMARIRAMDAGYLGRRLRFETPETVEEAVASRRPMIVVGMHFGAIEIPALYLASRVGQVTAPMETLADPALQGYLARTRAAVGIRLVGLRETRPALQEALGRGEPVGFVADRDITGGGLSVPLFGAPTRLPIGPALLAIDYDAPLYFAAVRRTGRGRYVARVERIPVPAGGTHRQRVTGFLVAEAAAMERAIADAPEQWWAAFSPIWPDLAGDSAGPATAAARPAPGTEPAR